MSKHRHDYDHTKRERARALYEQGLSVRKVADELGVTVSRAHGLLVEAGTEMRPAGQPRKEKTDGEMESSEEETEANAA